MLSKQPNSSNHLQKIKVFQQKKGVPGGAQALTSLLNVTLRRTIEPAASVGVSGGGSGEHGFSSALFMTVSSKQGSSSKVFFFKRLLPGIGIGFT